MNVLQAFPRLVERVESSSGDLDALAREIEEGSGLDAAVSYSELWQRIHQGAEATNIGGLSEITEFICLNARCLADSLRDDKLNPEHVRTLNGSVPLLKEFVCAPLDAEALGNLVQYLCCSDWPVAMDENQAYAIMARLLEQLQSEETPNLAADGAPEPPPRGDFNHDEPIQDDSPQDEPVQDDYRLDLPQDVHPKLAEAFFNEVPQLAEEFSRHIQNLAEGAGSREDLLRAQRLSHTIKGSSNVTGVPGVAALMHSCEDLLESLYEKHMLPDAELGQVLMETADCLASQLEYLLGQGPAPGQTEALVSILKGWHAGTPGRPHAESVPAEHSEAANGGGGAQEAGTAPAITESMRVPASLIENLLRQAGEVSISTVQLQGLGDTLDNRLNTLINQQNLLWEQLNTMQELVELRGVSATRSGGGRGGSAVFDPLEMDEYNELHSATSFLAESITDAREYTTQMREDLNKLRSMLKQQDILSRELSESVMGTRMVPFRSISSRLGRVVRQTSRSTGKQVELDIEGEEVLVDSAVLSRLADPLMHLLRNAVDHGIEVPHERLRAGKPETGRISIRVERHGDNVALLIQDDGEGLDYERIRGVASERGLIQGAPADVSHQELARLTLIPGFSTREEATQISGRGIGLDVVNTAVIEQRGTLDIHSEPGQGISVSIRVPMTLISVHTLLVKNSGVVLGVPSSSVRQLIFSDLGRFGQGDGEPVFEFEDRAYRAICLAHLIGIDSPMPDLSAPTPIPLLLVEGERESYAVILEEVLDNRYLVVKRLGRYVPRISGVIGGSILADGSIAAVVDIRELVRQRFEGAGGALQNIAQVTHTGAGRELPAVLVVDDSVSARRSLSELVSDAGYRSVTAIDGLEALTTIHKEKPAAILLDMEMPRMNGLELAAHLRADAGTSDIPLIMITSRSTEKHRRQAEMAGVDRYFTKPYHEDKLVDELHGLIQ